MGRVVQGKQEELESYADGEDEASEDAATAPVLTDSVAVSIPMLIEQAKQNLAAQLGVAPQQIEKIIRY